MRKLPAIVLESELLSQITSIQTLGKLGIPVVAISYDKYAIGFNSKYPYQKIISPMPHYDGSFINFLISKVNPGIIIYGSDSNAELISKHKDILLKNGFLLHISEYEKQIGLYDKYNLSEIAKKAGVGYPLSILINDENELERISNILSFPFILKPTKGAGGFYYLINNKNELQLKYCKLKKEINSSSYRHFNSSIIAQEFVNTNKQILWNYNAFYVGGIALGEFVGIRKRTPVRPDGRLGSSLLYGESKSNRFLIKNNQNFFNLIKYDGFVETEWVYINSKKEYILFDVNARQSGNIRWAIKGGVNLPYLYYQYCLEKNSNFNQFQIDNVTYHKIFWFNIDLIEAMRGRLMAGETKYSVFKSNIKILFSYQKCAIDVLDLYDLKPTLIIIKRLLLLAMKYLKRTIASRIFRAFESGGKLV